MKNKWRKVIKNVIIIKSTFHGIPYICNNNRAGDNNHDHHNDNSNIKYRVQQHYNNICNNNEENKYNNNVGILKCGYNVNRTTNRNGHRMSFAM